MAWQDRPGVRLNSGYRTHNQLSAHDTYRGKYTYSLPGWVYFLLWFGFAFSSVARNERFESKWTAAINCFSDAGWTDGQDVS